MSADKLRDEIFSLVEQYYEKNFTDKDFQIGDRINYGGRYFDGEELHNLVDAALDFWLTSGRYVKSFESEFSKFLHVKFCSVVNSGSSANLLAFYALTAEELGERRIKKGDEVITAACCFPTTVAPIVQYGAVPVFVDVDIPSYNVNVEALEKALSEKTKAIMLAHTLGNPFNLRAVKAICKKYNLWLIEDNCDALGSMYEMEDGGCYTGTIGDIGTSSFYPPHHITMGEGGAVYTNNYELKKLINSYRDWGRDCYCDSGVDNTCKMRFSRVYGDLPLGYDHKYVYSHLGFNLKATECQAAVGCAQLKKLPKIIELRRQNWEFLRTKLEKYSDVLILSEPEPYSTPSWFGFALTAKKQGLRDLLVKHLEENNVQTRMLFASNIVRHPCFKHLSINKDYRIAGELYNTDRILSNTFWLGVYPKLDVSRLNYIVQLFEQFFN